METSTSDIQSSVTGCVNSYATNIGNQTAVTPSTEPGIQSGDWTLNISGIRFTSNGKYVSGYVDSTQELMQILENYRTVTGTGFTNAQSLATALKSIEESHLQTRFISPASRPRLFWQMNAGEPKIPYDGVPFVSSGQNTDLPCVRYGGRRKKCDQVALPSGDVIPIDYRQKAGCEARITIRRVIRFPSASFVEPVSQGIGSIRRSRKHVLDELVLKIAAGVVKSSERYFFLLPTPSAHCGHTVTDIEPPPTISQHVSDAILSQLSNGVTDIVQIREHSKSGIDSIFGAEAALHINDPSFLPSEYDVFRQVYWLYKTGQVIDQENALQASIGGLFTQTMSTPPAPPPITSSSAAAEAITSVYSIIMDDGGDSNVHQSSLSHLGDNPLSSERDVDISSSYTNAFDTIETSQSPNTYMSTMVSQNAPINLTQLVKRVAPTRVNPIAPSRPADPIEDTTSISQAQREVRDMLRIIENQSHACLNESALNSLRRQLTELCSQFSMYLAGVPSSQFGIPPSKKMKL